MRDLFYFVSGLAIGLGIGFGWCLVVWFEAKKIIKKLEKK